MDLCEIRDLSRLLESGYVDAYRKLTQSRDVLDSVRSDGTPSLKHFLAAALHSYKEWSNSFRDYRLELARLGQLVYRNMPETAKKLRIVTDRVLDPAPDLDALIEELRLIRIEATTGSTEPKAYCQSWSEILDALGLKNSSEKRDQVRRLNEDHGGPIILGKRGVSPKVDRSKLIQWWNGLETRFAELAQREMDQKASTESQYEHGRRGTVVPDISGEVKKRRGK